MCAITQACSRESGDGSFEGTLAAGAKRNSAACQRRKPINLNATPVSGSSTIARSSNPRSLALSRQNLRHLSTASLEQSVLHQLGQQILEIPPQQLSVHFVFAQERVVGRLNRIRRGKQGPHARTYLIEAEIAFVLKIEQDGLALDLPKQDFCWHPDARCERNGQSNALLGWLFQIGSLPAGLKEACPTKRESYQGFDADHSHSTAHVYSYEAPSSKAKSREPLYK